jgi:methionyl-tRNA synthetase
MITFDEFKKAEIKIGTILSAEKIPEADKLIKLMINLGPKQVEIATVAPVAPEVTQGELDELAEEEEKVTPQEPVDDIRQILSGIAEHYPDPSVLVGKQVPVLTNLPTRTIRGYESQGMVLYAVGTDFLTTVGPSREIPNGTNVQ